MLMIDPYPKKPALQGLPVQSYRFHTSDEDETRFGEIKKKKTR